MRIWVVGFSAVVLAVAGCDDGDLLVLSGKPDAPRGLEGFYYNGGVDLSWKLGPKWEDEIFRVYGKRTEDPEYFLIAEMTSCADGRCGYRDTNVRPGYAYEYFVAAADPDSGLETESASVEVYVPRPVPPPVPSTLEAVALDDAVYVHWSDHPAAEDDFWAYRVYLREADGDFFLGETDSSGFVDLVAENGSTYTYFVTSVDDQGHESDGSETVSSTPRPDYSDEFMYTYQDEPGASGFRFQESENLPAVVSGDRADRHFRLEADARGLWLAPGPSTRIYPEARWTTALKCGVAADSDCTSWERAPRSGYSRAELAAEAGFTYMFQVSGDDGEVRFGAVRVSRTGFDQDGLELIVFDWAYQTQAGNPNLDAVSANGG